MAKTMFKPETDGKDHINMYSKARTEFGQMLSDFYRCLVSTPYGTFNSVEGLWYYLSLPEELPEREEMKRLYGFFAKKRGRELRKLAKQRGLELRKDPDFEATILAAIRRKIKANKHLWKPKYAGLSIVHYYTWDGNVKDVTDDFPWLVNGITEIVREMLG